MTRIQVFDPPMCCPSGVCGPSVNPALPRFAADVEWLKRQGVQIERYTLSSQPAAFVQNQVVKDALNNDGNDCLPLIVVNGTIVSRGIYPIRSDLMKFSGIGSEKAAAEPAPAETSSVAVGNGAPVCGPGCACGTPSGSGKLKMVVSLIVLLAVASILIYRASSKGNAPNVPVPAGGAAFAFAQPAPSVTPETAEQPPASAMPDAANQQAAGSMPAATTQPSASATPAAATQPSANATPDAAKADQKVGEYLESLSALNRVAISQDAVFVFIPAPKNELADAKTNTAVLAAQRTLKAAKITLGLYTLRSSSPDYAGISAQVQAPAILVASKGKGMAAVSGDVTEDKLLQAFMATSRAGGCGPASSGCGPASAGCN